MTNKPEISLPENLPASLPVLTDFEPVTLSKIENAGLLNRFDSKYWLNKTEIADILGNLRDHYFILEIDGKRIQHYHNYYYDTDKNTFYTEHHNGKQKRYKIRKRLYVDTNLAFLEIKMKNNKDKTDKKRLRINEILSFLSSGEMEYLHKRELANTENLTIRQENYFDRITLVSKNFDERCTIDFNITFESSGKKLCLENLVITELKKGSLHGHSQFAVQLRKHGIFEKGFSKYCIGRALMETGIKKNMFKSKILELEKKYGYISPDQAQ